MPSLLFFASTSAFFDSTSAFFASTSARYSCQQRKQQAEQAGIVLYSIALAWQLFQRNKKETKRNKERKEKTKKVLTGGNSFLLAFLHEFFLFFFLFPRCVVIITFISVMWYLFAPFQAAQLWLTGFSSVFRTKKRKNNTKKRNGKRKKTNCILK
jgi:hypothetical protein